MSGDFNTAFIILIVGMITIFLVLSLVVISGNLLIKIVNRFHTEEIPAMKDLSTPDSNESNPFPKTHNTDDKEIAALVTAVDILTKGKGTITSIKKIN